MIWIALPVRSQLALVAFICSFACHPCLCHTQTHTHTRTHDSSAAAESFTFERFDATTQLHSPWCCMGT